MPGFAPCTITKGSYVDRERTLCAKGPSDKYTPNEGCVELSRIVRERKGYSYTRDENYSAEFPVDEHLYEFIRQYVSARMDADDEDQFLERTQLERAILLGRDSMLGTCSFSFPSVPPGRKELAHFPDPEQLGFFRPDQRDMTIRSTPIKVGEWEINGKVYDGPSRVGLILAPSGRHYASDKYTESCMLGNILKCNTTSWYDKWSVVPSHRFKFGATEWLMGILHHYSELLEQVGIRHAVTAALYNYPCHAGLLQGLAERFNRRFNTFATAEGETSLDLWSFHRISGLPLFGGLYEEVNLSDVHLYKTNGKGKYVMPHSCRYLMKVWRDLARHGRDEDKVPQAAKTSVKVTSASWALFFYHGPFRFHESFAGDTMSWDQYYQISVNFHNDGKKPLHASSRGGWNPHDLPDRTHLAAYLVYWLNTFVVPCGEESLIRCETIYPACLLADGWPLAIAPAALANIFHQLGNLTSSPSPKDRSLCLPTHYLSTWAAYLFPEVCQNTNLENPSAPLIFSLRNCQSSPSYPQLTRARYYLSFLPTHDKPGLNFACCNQGYRPFSVAGNGGLVYKLPHQDMKSDEIIKGWLRCIRPSVLVYRKGTSVLLEPYFPFRFARNFGYDQLTPPDIDFPLKQRVYKCNDRHLVAAGWWFFHSRHEPEYEYHLPGWNRSGQVDVHYARWWSRHNATFRKRGPEIKAAESTRLGRLDLPPVYMAKDFQERNFRGSNVPPAPPDMQPKGSQEGKYTYMGRQTPLQRPGDVADQEKAKPTERYSWWIHFLSDCGYALNVELSTPIVPDGHNNEYWPLWETHLRESIIRLGPLDHLCHLEDATCLGDIWNAVKKTSLMAKMDVYDAVLPPGFGVGPAASMIPISDKRKRQKEPAATPKKRQAMAKGGPSTRAATSRAKESFRQADQTSPAVEAEVEKYVAPVDEGGNDDLGVNDYNPVSDGSPSGEKDVDPTIGTSSHGKTVDDDFFAALYDGVDFSISAHHGDQYASNLEAFTQLLNNGPVEGLPDFSRMNRNNMNEAGTAPATFHAMVISSTSSAAEVGLQGEGEIVPGSMTDRDGVATVPLTEERSAYGFQGGDQHINATSPLGSGAMSSSAPPPPIISGQGMPVERDAISETGDNLDTEANIPEGQESDNPPDIGEVRQSSVGPAMVMAEANNLPKDVEPSATLSARPGADLRQIEEIVVSEDAPLSHGVSWPNGRQPRPLPGTEMFLGIFGNGVRTVIQGEVMPDISTVRDLLQDNTITYFRTGHPAGPWMESVNILWEEYLDRRAEIAWQANCLKIQALQSSISAAKEELSGLRLEVEGIQKQRGVLVATEAAEQLQLKTVEKNIEDLVKIASALKASLGTHAQSIQEANVNVTQLGDKLQILEQKISSEEAKIVALEKHKPRHI